MEAYFKCKLWNDRMKDRLSLGAFIKFSLQGAGLFEFRLIERGRGQFTANENRTL